MGTCLCELREFRQHKIRDTSRYLPDNATRDGCVGAVGRSGILILELPTGTTAPFPVAAPCSSPSRSTPGRSYAPAGCRRDDSCAHKESRVGRGLRQSPANGRLRLQVVSELLLDGRSQRSKPRLEIAQPESPDATSGRVLNTERRRRYLHRGAASHQDADWHRNRWDRPALPCGTPPPHHHCRRCRAELFHRSSSRRADCDSPPSHRVALPQPFCSRLRQTARRQATSWLPPSPHFSERDRLRLRPAWLAHSQSKPYRKRNPQLDRQDSTDTPAAANGSPPDSSPISSNSRRADRAPVCSQAASFAESQVQESLWRTRFVCTMPRRDPAEPLDFRDLALMLAGIARSLRRTVLHELERPPDLYALVLTLDQREATACTAQLRAPRRRRRKLGPHCHRAIELKAPAHSRQMRAL